MNSQQVDVLIIGAGPSGCVSAAYLHQKGYTIKVIEKAKFPRFVIGESLLPRCMDHFQEVDLLACLEAEQFEIKKGARFIRNDEVCNFDFSKKHTEGWNYTWQVPRAEFDEALTNELQQKGVPIAFEEMVVDVSFDASGNSFTQVQTNAGDLYTISAKYIIDASGYGRVLPRILGLDKPARIPQHSSIFVHVNDIYRPDGEEGTLITFDVLEKEVWLWVIPFSNGKTSLGIVGPTEWIDSFEGSSTEKFLEILKKSTHYYHRFKDATLLFEPIQLKNYAKSVSKLYGKGFVLTGNSAEFLDPVFSSGVTFATESGLLSAKLIHREIQQEPVDWEKEYTQYIMEGIQVFETYVREWYSGKLQKIFFHRPENKEVKKQICSVLAGYVWDQTNPFVKHADRLVNTIAKVIDIEVESNSNYK